jgi:hypothetical protein
MTTTELTLTDAMAAKLLIAGTVCGVSGHAFVLSTIEAGLQCMADENPKVARAFADIDQREAPVPV